MDAPGTLHHVMGRGIERIKIFRNQKDREDFLARLADLCREEKLIVYAWALIFSRTAGTPKVELRMFTYLYAGDHRTWYWEY